MNSEVRQGPPRLVALVSGGGTTVRNLHARIAAGDLNARLAGVIASRPCRGAQWAAEAGLPCRIIRRGDFDGVESFSQAVTEAVDAAAPDLVVLAGYLQLWQFPRRYDDRVMNIHPALLPSFGGAGMWGHHVHEAVLAAGCKVSGCTVHFCDHQYDTGPIIVQRCVDVLEGDTPDTLAARVFQQECIAYPEAVKLFTEGRLRIDGRIVHVEAP
ncbi:MAG: phosphoribosylglycinamide formyltransferase [Planctomycetes bacterium]|nr:phosphoribosylglycinamide formyltransferase [Planctomycetota bacterium]